MSEGMLPKKPNRNIDTLGQFLEFDRQVLRFYGYWDDRQSLHGLLHDLEIHYYLADDTIEIKEIIPPNAGRDYGFLFLHRCKLAKVSYLEGYMINGLFINHIAIVMTERNFMLFFVMSINTHRTFQQI